MGPEAVDAFKTYLMSPLLLAQIFGLMIFVCLMIAVLKVLKNGATELRESSDENFDHTDYVVAIFRVVFVLTILMVFFGF